MKNDDILATARARMKEAQDADRDNRLEDYDDLEKLVGKQWPDEIRAERDSAGRPCLTLNRLPQFVRQVTGDIRKMNPAIKVIPTDGGASPEVAKIYEALIRQIENDSNASRVYERAAEQAAASSLGWFRILAEYENDDSFNQVIKIAAIRNPMSVYFDPAAQDPTRADANYIFITEQMSAKDFEAAYPGKSASSADHDGETDGRELWQSGGNVVVAEYYWKEPVERKIALLEDGRVIPADEVPPFMNVAKTRTVKTHKVMWAKISGNDVLEGPKEQVCQHIPVIAVAGEEWHVGERVYRSSVIRYAKDAQQAYNYARSAQAEFVGLQPKAPFLVTTKHIAGAGISAIWDTVNTKNLPYLPYTPDPNAPPPSRIQPPVSSSGLMEQALSASEDLKATTGIYDAALGASGNEKSGVAIRQRQMEADVSTSIYSDNMAEAIRACGRVLVSMIPKIYDTNRLLRVIGEDGENAMVEVNGAMMANGGPMTVNDLSLGRYDVVVSVGPNYSTRRQETAEGMMEFIRVFPAAAQLTGDLVAKAMDWPDADKFAERLAPPTAAEQTPEQQQAAMQAMAQQQAAMQMQMRKVEADVRKAEAGADEAEADAMAKQIELALESGQMNAAIAALVQQEVARALQGAFQPQL